MYDRDHWRKVERRRELFAERLARELAVPVPDAPRGSMSEFVAGAVVRTPWEGAVEAHEAFVDAPRLLALGGRFGIIGGYAGDVLYVHQTEGGTWSLVVPYAPWGTPILVCVDDIPDHCLGIYEDGPEAIKAIAELRSGLERAWETRRWSQSMPDYRRKT